MLVSLGTLAPETAWRTPGWPEGFVATSNDFGRATLLESWELALSLAEQPCCRAGMMVSGEFGRDVACTASGRATAGQSRHVLLRLRVEWVRGRSEDGQ